MPYDEVMGKFKRGELRSGSDKGPKVKNRSQAIAIMLSEKRAAKHGKEEYQPVKKYNKGGDVKPSTENMTKQNLIETVVNPTGPTGLKKGGAVTPASRGGWKRWGQKGYGG